MKSRLFASVLALMLASLGAADSSDPKPWTHQNFDADPGKFSFAIHADLTGGERPGIFATAMAQLKLLRPDFVISVGDLIEGGEIQRDQFEAEWEVYDNQVRSFPGPIFYVGGNHDLSTDLSREVWAERYGPTYYHFRYKNVLFLVLDTEDTSPADRTAIAEARAKAVEIYKSDGPDAFAQTEYASLAHRKAGTIGKGQRDYFLEVIEQNADVRWTFLFVHKPAWQQEGDTPFAEIETALSERPYTVFNGHVQAYDYKVRKGRDYIQLATTGGEQFPDLGLSEDHVTLVTMTDSGPNVTNLMLSGIRDKTGAIPLGGDDLCFSVEQCEEDQ